MFDCKVIGRFSLFSNKRGKLGECTNLITDVGLDSLIQSDISSSHGIVVGRGTEAPLPTDTLMGSIVAGSTVSSPRFSSRTFALTTAPYGCMYRQAVRFTEGSVTGNLSEIGFVRFKGTQRTSNYTLISRTLIKNAEGIPTTITLLSDEILDAVYEVYFHTSIEEATGTLTFTGNIGGTYDWRILPAYVTTRASQVYENGWDASQAFGSTTSQTLRVSSQGLGTAFTGILEDAAPGSSAAATESRLSSYVSGSFTVPFALSIPTNAGNLAGGLKSIQFKAGKGMYQIEFTPAIPKTDLDSILIEFNMQLSRG